MNLHNPKAHFGSGFQPRLLMQGGWLHFWLLGVLAALSLGSYLLISRQFLSLGFPLDDAWIHQVYARNLAETGEWAFIPGQPSAGSTSPLWSVLLMLGYISNTAPLLWTYLLGYILLWAIALVGTRIFCRFYPSQRRYALWVGVLLVFEWHLVWAAGSGMETLLFTLLILSVAYLLMDKQISWVKVGLLIGFCVWVRPDGLTLLGPAFLVGFLVSPGWKGRVTALGTLMALMLLLFALYLRFNYLLSGGLLPNTFYAKQAEYAIYLQYNLIIRLYEQHKLLIVGAGVLLAPGFLWLIYRALQEKKWPILGMSLWVLGYLCLFALRLPVTYQHGRYQIPAMAVYLVLGAVGSNLWVNPSYPIPWKRVVSRVWLISISSTLFVFWLKGAWVYAQDVAVIETEMVATAHWVAKNTEPQALVAVHDIGAMGYFCQRRLLDLAGLVSPEVIPFLRDENRLEEYLNDQGADYLVTFPGWYPRLTGSRQILFTTGGQFAPALGGENMAVYRWP